MTATDRSVDHDHSVYDEKKSPRGLGRCLGSRFSLMLWFFMMFGFSKSVLEKANRFTGSDASLLLRCFNELPVSCMSFPFTQVGLIALGLVFPK